LNTTGFFFFNICDGEKEAKEIALETLNSKNNGKS